MTWALIVWSVLMAAWIVAGTASTSPSETCAGDRYRSACEAGAEAGAGIGIAALILLWFLGFVVLSLIWFMTRPRDRECPACGVKVKRGLTACSKCEHDFAAAATR